MKLYKLIFVFAFLPFLSCSKENTGEKTPADLAGSWTWVRTDGGIGNNIHDTPASTGKNIELVLSSDSKYSFYTNGILTSQGSFSLPAHNCIHDNNSKKVLDFSSPAATDLMIESNNGVTLIVSDEYLDGTISEFRRN